MKLPHWFGYRVYFDDEKNLCLKGRGFYFFYVLAMMLGLCVGLPFAAFTDKTTVISGMAFFLLFVLFILGVSSSIDIIFFKPIQRSITFARSGTITVRDTMIIGRRSFGMKLEDIACVTFAYYRLRTRTGYRVLVRFKDGMDQSLNEDNILLYEKQAKKAIQDLRTLLTEVHRDSFISVLECSIDVYKFSISRPKHGRKR